MAPSRRKYTFNERDDTIMMSSGEPFGEDKWIADTDKDYGPRIAEALNYIRNMPFISEGGDGAKIEAQRDQLQAERGLLQAERDLLHGYLGIRDEVCKVRERTIAELRDKIQVLQEDKAILREDAVANAKYIEVWVASEKRLQDVVAKLEDELVEHTRRFETDLATYEYALKKMAAGPWSGMARDALNEVAKRRA